MHPDDPTTYFDQLNLIPDPDRRRARENERRIEEWIKKKLAADVESNSSYYRRFLVSD